MLIGCTRKVAHSMKEKLNTMNDICDNFYCWHVTEFEIYGDKIFLFMNNHTRFPLFMHHMDESILLNLESHFVKLFQEAMRYLHIPKEAVDYYLTGRKLHYCKSWDRSILSQMNDLAHVYKYNVMHGVHNFYLDVDASLDYSEIPCLKYNFFPKDKMHEEMMRIYGEILGVL